MNDSKLHLRNSSEIDINGTITLSGGSLIEVTSGSEFRLEPGSCLYGTDHTIYEDPKTGEKFETWEDAYNNIQDITKSNSIPGDRIVINNAILQALGERDNPVTIAAVGDGCWDGIEINNYDSWGSDIYYGNISGVHLQLNNSYLELYHVTYSNCGQISAINNSCLFVENSTIEDNNVCPIYSCESTIHFYNSTIQNNLGKGIYAYLPSDYPCVMEEDTIITNDGWGAQFIDVPIFCFFSNITNNTSHGFVSYGAAGTPVLGGNTIANNGGIEIIGLDQWPDMTSYLGHGPNTVYSQDNGGADHYLLATTVQESDCRGNIIDTEDHTRFSPSFDYYIFDSEESEEKILYAAAVEDISEEEYESAKTTMAEIVDGYPDTDTAVNALQWLLYLESFSGNDYTGLRAYAESIDDVSYPNLEKIKNKIITSAYMCEKDYLTSIDRLEDIIADPSSVEDSILALIHEGYCYLKLDEEEKTALKECTFKPNSFNEYKYISQKLFDNLLYKFSTESHGTGSQQDEFSLHPSYPNPAFSYTTFSFSIPANTKNTELKIYNIKGQLVKTFIPESNEKGITDNFKWDCKDENGKTLCNGIYLYKLTADKKEIVKKMVLLR